MRLRQVERLAPKATELLVEVDPNIAAMIQQRRGEANDGVFWVRDAPGSGCVFTIDLPRNMQTKKV